MAGGDGFAAGSQWLALSSTVIFAVSARGGTQRMSSAEGGESYGAVVGEIDRRQIEITLPAFFGKYVVLADRRVEEATRSDARWVMVVILRARNGICTRFDL